VLIVLFGVLLFAFLSEAGEEEVFDVKCLDAYRMMSLLHVSNHAGCD
jgi:hypothetical protein